MPASGPIVFDSIREFNVTHPDIGPDEIIHFGEIPKSLSNKAKENRESKYERWGGLTRCHGKPWRERADFYRKNRENGYREDGRIYSIEVLHQEMEKCGLEPPLVGKWILFDDGYVAKATHISELKHNSGKKHLNILAVKIGDYRFKLYESFRTEYSNANVVSRRKNGEFLNAKQKRFARYMVITGCNVMASFSLAYPKEFSNMTTNGIFDFDRMAQYIYSQVFNSLMWKEMKRLSDNHKELMVLQEKLDKYGISPDSLIKNLKDLAFSAKNENAKRSATIDLMQMRGIDPETVKERFTELREEEKRKGLEDESVIKDVEITVEDVPSPPTIDSEGGQIVKMH